MGIDGAFMGLSTSTTALNGIGLLERLPKCKSLEFISLLPLLW